MEQSSGGSPDVVAYALQLLEQMAEKGILPNIVAYSSLARCFARSGDWATVERLSKKMEADGLRMNEYLLYALLFVGTRMRAFLITNGKGAPQGWVLDGMYMATWAVLIQSLLVLGVAAAMAFEGKLGKPELERHREVRRR